MRNLTSVTRLFLIVACLVATREGILAQASGPDLAISGILSPIQFGSAGGITAFSFGVEACNLGDQGVLWHAADSRHPVRIQNLYRLEDGIFEQIGMSWAHHGFCALSMSTCGPCMSSGSCTALGPSCSTTNSASSMGGQFGLGPRSEIDPSSGFVIYPFSSSGASVTFLERRLQVQTDDLSPVLHPAARYFVEVQAISEDDQLAGNESNNASYRELVVSGPNFNLSPIGPTEMGGAAIYAWQQIDPQVQIQEVQIAGDGWIQVASQVTSLASGMYRYQYVVRNHNSTRSVSAVSIPIQSSTLPSSIEFNDVHHHSGEPYSGLDWSSSLTADCLIWETESYASNENANAIRWGTAYRFSFESLDPPQASQLELGIFAPGGQTNITAAIMAPAVFSQLSDFTRGDCNADSTLNLADAVFLLTGLLFPQGSPAVIDCLDACDANDDGGHAIDDAISLLSALFGPVQPLPEPANCAADPTADGLDCSSFPCP